MAHLKIQHFDDDQQTQLDKLIRPDNYNWRRMRRYIKRTRQPFFATEGVLRLAQSVVNHCTNDPIEVDTICRLFKDFFDKCAIPPVELASKLVKLIEPAYDLSPGNVITQRNLSFVLMTIVELYATEEFRFDDDTVRQMVQLMSRVVNECEHLETVLYAVMAIEKLATLYKVVVIEEQLRESLTRLAEYLHQVNEVTVYHFPNIEPFRYNLAFLSQWFLEQNSKLSENPLKISSDGSSVFNTSLESNLPFRSAFAVTSGVFYYEVILLTSGNITVGWATKEFLFARYRLIDNKNMIAFNAERREIEHNSKSEKIINLPEWRAGDVLGCLIDSAKKEFVFYYNGQRLLNSMKDLFFSTQPYFAYAHIKNLTSCHFNFGQMPFKYPPEEFEFITFHLATNGNFQKYRLLEPLDESRNYNFWFKCELNDDGKVNKFFADEQLEMFDTWVSDAQNAVLAQDNQEDPVFEALKTRAKNLLTPNEGMNELRFIQSVIEVIGADLTDDNVETVVQWIMKTFKECNQDRYPYKMLEFFYSYFLVQPDCAQNIAIRRNMFILLNNRYCIYFFRMSDYPMDIVSAIVSNVLQHEDKWTLQMAIKCIDAFISTSDPDLHCKMDISALLNQLLFYFTYVTNLNLYDSQLDRLRYQLINSARWYLNNAVMLANDLEELALLKYSADGFAVGNDRRGFSTVQSAFLVKSSVFYYEVILLSPYGIRAGWGCKRNEFESTAVGDSDTSISLGCKKIWHHGEAPIESMSDWKEGDVLGCLIDVPNRLFAFYQNGERINLPPNLNVHFSNQPYFAAATLHFGAKCYFNFGQIGFKYPPENVEFNNFHNEANGNALKYRLLERSFAA